jgi:hypothetical protein
MSRQADETSPTDRPRAQADASRPRATLNASSSTARRGAEAALLRGLCAPERRAASCEGRATCPGPGAACGSGDTGRSLPVLLRRDA